MKEKFRKWLNAFNAFYNWWTNLIEDSTATVWTLHTWKRLKALWSDFFVAAVTNIDHVITTWAR